MNPTQGIRVDDALTARFAETSVTRASLLERPETSWYETCSVSRFLKTEGDICTSQDASLPH
jgi:hypothetical protein